MVYDYLGLPKNHIGTYPKNKKLKSRDDGFLNMNNDYLGLARFASENIKDVNRGRNFVKKEVKDYRTAYDEIKGEVKAFRKDVGSGGWVGDYIRRKQLAKKQRKPKKLSKTF